MVDALVVVVHRHGEHLLRVILTDNSLVEVLVNLPVDKKVAVVSDKRPLI